MSARLLFLARKFVTFICVAGVLVAAANRELALPGYHFQFPQDYFSHPTYETEWWYYTGNLQSSDRHEFGFELTFFRYRPDAPANEAIRNPVWFPGQIYIAHFALTDISEKHFFHEERMNRAGPGLAGIDAARGEIWNGNWSAHWLSFQPATQEIEAVTRNAHLRLTLKSMKPLVVHGRDGVSRRGPKPGQSSHYYSFTRIATTGNLSFEGKNYPLSGETWMDREFFTTVKDDAVAGWDWMCIRLNTHQELMLYRWRLKDGTASAYSSGTFVEANGDQTFLDHSQFSLEPLRTWHSARSGADYPVEWRIEVPSKQLTLLLKPALDSQELVNRITRTYWEGAVRYSGTETGARVSGDGYLEMTGYGRGKPEQTFDGAGQR